jgi:hypothetical protein
VVRLVTGADLCGLFVAQQVASGYQSAHVSVVGEDISADQLGKKMHQIRESCLFLEKTKKTLRCHLYRNQSTWGQSSGEGTGASLSKNFISND